MIRKSWVYVCLQCGKSYRTTTKPSDLKGKNRVCSFSCAGKRRYLGTTRESRFWRHVFKTDYCWFWIGSTKGLRRAYGSFDGEMAHRASWQFATKNKIPDGMAVCHSCDNFLCVRPDHLFLGTQKENIQDAKAKGKMAKIGRGGVLCDS